MVKGGNDMFKIGQIIPCDEVRKYIKSLDEIDEEILDVYTKLFDSYICQRLKLSDLDYSRIDWKSEFDLIVEYSENTETMPPIVTSPSFNGQRIVYDGCHRCCALELNEAKEVIALIPYKTVDGRLIKDIENNTVGLKQCKYGKCDKSKCCITCDNKDGCGGICIYCFEFGSICEIISNNVELFCDGVW